MGLAERGGRIDAAVLDVDLAGLSAEPVADLLARRGVPLLFATGYGEAPQGHRGTPALSKPFTERALAAALGAMLGGPRAAPAA